VGFLAVDHWDEKRGVGFVAESPIQKLLPLAAIQKAIING
jgi:hypothetical protein